jgi:hypothetical protein
MRTLQAMGKYRINLGFYTAWVDRRRLGRGIIPAAIGLRSFAPAQKADCGPVELHLHTIAKAAPKLGAPAPSHYLRIAHSSETLALQTCCE